MLALIRTAVLLFGTLTLLTGAAYPLLVTGLAQSIFPKQANGSLISDAQGKTVGSKLIGQPFSDPQYFWGRSSATASYPYNAAASGGSNLGPSNPALARAVRARVEALRVADPENRTPVPVDLVTASASGLDPHISPAAAEYQVGRVARARGLDVERVEKLVAENTEGRLWGVFGEPVMNVLAVNLALGGQVR